METHNSCITIIKWLGSLNVECKIGTLILPTPFETRPLKAVKLRSALHGEEQPSAMTPIRMT